MAWVKARRVGPATTLNRNPVYPGDTLEAPEDWFDGEAGWERLTEPTPTVSVGNPSEGLTVSELKARLEAQGVEVPKGARKADLLNLLRR